MSVTIHFIAKPGRDAELHARLRALGIEAVKVLPGGKHVLLTADPEAVASRLGLTLEEKPHEVRVGPARVPASRPSVREPARLPAAIAELVERWYIPEAPDRLGGTTGASPPPRGIDAG